MAEYGAALVSGLGAAIAAVLGAYALVVKAKATAGRPMQLLRRLWDWIEGEDLHEQVPPTLRSDVERQIGQGADDE